MQTLIDWCGPCLTEPEWCVDMCHCPGCEGMFLAEPTAVQYCEAVRESIEQYVRRLANGEDVTPIYVMRDDDPTDDEPCAYCGAGPNEPHRPIPEPWPQGNPNRIPSIDWSGPTEPREPWGRVKPGITSEPF